MRYACSVLLATALSAFAQPHQPNLDAQREAMKKLDFLVGKWSGDASVTMGPGAPVKVRQSEDVQFKLDGLLLLIEGTGRDPESGKVVFNALATVTYDDAAGKYRFRSHSRGHYLDTEMKVEGKGFEWGMQAGPGNIRYVMKLNDKGEWVETGDMIMGSNPPRRIIEMKVTR